MKEPYIRCDYQGGPRHDRCPNEAARVALWAGRPVRRARRCESHVRQARELGYDLRPVTLGERAGGAIDRAAGIKRRPERSSPPGRPPGIPKGRREEGRRRFRRE